jgi:pimeloyl-ACP methyl ester carboxylesterase
MMRSRLVYLESNDGEDSMKPTLIAVGGNLREMHEFATGLGLTHVISPQGLYGLYEGAMDLVARNWFYDEYDLPHPEPISFGHSLRAIEALIYGVHDSLASSAVPPVLLGHGQGGALALALALVIPDYLSGVISIDGVLPAFNGWSPYTDADALPVLMVTDTTTKPSSESEVALVSAGCRVVAGTATDTALPGPLTSKVISDWLRADLRTCGPADLRTYGPGKSFDVERPA